MCTAYFVDEATKKKIAAYSAKFRQATASPFGADDEIGMLNLISPASRDAAPRSTLESSAPIAHVIGSTLIDFVPIDAARGGLVDVVVMSVLVGCSSSIASRGQMTKIDEPVVLRDSRSR